MATRPSAEAPFGGPVNLGPTVNRDGPDGGPLLSRDGLTLLFNSGREGGQGGHDLWMCMRTAPDAPFGEPVNLGSAVNSDSNDGDPALSPNGLTLLFISDRPGGQGAWDLWMCARPGPDAPFATAVNLGPAVNSEANDGGPCFSRDGLTLLFASNRPGGSGGTDLWMCRRIGTPPADDARWGPWEDLFDGKTMNGWKAVEKFGLWEGKPVIGGKVRAG